MTTLKTFKNTEFTMLGEDFSILKNDEGKMTLAIDSKFSKDFFFDKDGLLKFAKRNVKNLNEEMQNEILNYIKNI
jgi:hypothetical protein